MPYFIEVWNIDTRAGLFMFVLKSLILLHYMHLDTMCGLNLAYGKNKYKKVYNSIAVKEMMIKKNMPSLANFFTWTSRYPLRIQCN